MTRGVRLPWTLVQTARATRAQLAGAPVSDAWKRDAISTQLRLAAGRVRHEGDAVRVPIGDFEVAGFSVSSLALLHLEIFVQLHYYFRARNAEPVIVDGGSNIGLSVLFFKALYPSARVIAFEPAEAAYRLLVRNVEVNCREGVEVQRTALGPSNGDVAFYDEPDDPATFRMSTRRERLPNPRETVVSQRRLSDFVDGPIDLVKLDVEGAEDDVLDDLIESGAIVHVDQLVVEYHHHLVPDADALGSFLERLRAHGFGYQVSAREPVDARRSRGDVFQDVLVYGYRRLSSAAA